MKNYLGILFGFILSSHVVAYDKTVPFVDMDRFAGDWYVVAGRFTPFEKQVHNAIESYHWHAKSGTIDISFHYNKGSLTGPVKSLPQRGWIHNKETNAHWKVSPLWPFKFDYLVIGLAEDYSWTVIGVPNEAYVWIMSRDPHMSREDIQAIIEELEQEGYNTKRIVYVPHSP